METMSIRIYQKRKEMGYTMEELGEKVGVSKSTVNKWEKGQIKNIKQSTIKKLSIVLECDPVWLAGLDTYTDHQTKPEDLWSANDIDMYNKVKSVLQNPAKRKVLVHVINGLYEDNEI